MGKSTKRGESETVPKGRTNHESLNQTFSKIQGQMCRFGGGIEKIVFQ